ncbi:hypothetical protein [Deinococcus peraridilitoris]|uniref:Uncharacterized protein n=1 Tax=Deinococcus peraridilitoris (strain DSM 19664 / LMG 22246 / CIP 109416 / KR-200) TaxID=937777 RepID=K9ZXA3_DEIPD|nr:hypothetical protein [Deinococcus peraridilitoris]AFZ66283.1 hypothetical protein Deipe_0704 [Deinococcus peraridilitoris DSM 19664]
MTALLASPVLDFVLCALLALVGLWWGGQARRGLTASGSVLGGLLSGGLLLLLIFINLGGNLVPVVVGVVAHLVGSCAAVFSSGPDT